MKQAEDREAHLELQVQRAAAQVAANQFNKRMDPPASPSGEM